jgi:O-antigen ligase
VFSTGVCLFLYKVAFVENTDMMWMFAVTLICASLMAVFLVIKPFAIFMVYFALFPVLQVFNNYKMDVPGTKASFAFGGIVLLVVMVSGGIACIKRISYAYKECRYIILLFALMIMWMFIGIFVNRASIDIFSALKEVGRILGIFVIFLLGLAYSRDMKDVKILISVYFISLLIPVCVGIYQIMSGTMYIEIEGYNRIMSTFGIPNMFAMYLVFPLIITLILLLNRKTFDILSVITFSGLLLLSVMLFFTYSRASWLAFALGGIFVFWKYYPKYIPFVLIAGFLLLSFISVEQLRLGSTGSSGRISLWMMMLPAAVSSPVFGHGVTSMGSISNVFFGSVNQGQNEYLLHLVESGIPGLILFLSFIWAVLVKCWKCFRSLSDQLYSGLYLGMFSYLLGILCIGFFESNAWFQNWVWFPAGAYLGAYFNSRQSITEYANQEHILKV